jgi:hypothetical protein
MPTGLVSTSEHLVVYVPTAITQNLIEIVPVPFAPSIREIDLGDQDLLFVEARGAGHWPPRLRNDETLADKGLPTLMKPNPLAALNHFTLPVAIHDFLSEKLLAFLQPPFANASALPHEKCSLIVGRCLI